MLSCQYNTYYKKEVTKCRIQTYIFSSYSVSRQTISDCDNNKGKPLCLLLKYCFSFVSSVGPGSISIASKDGGVPVCSGAPFPQGENSYTNSF